MLIAQMTPNMYFGKGLGDMGLQSIEIPAYLDENNNLIIGDNGESKKYSHYATYEAKAEEFEFFCNHLYRGSSKPVSQFLRNGIPYELMRVTEAKSNNILYTFLWPCREDTYFCQCKDCGKKYVVDCYESPHYLVKKINVPTVRCRECINHRATLKVY